MIRDWKVVKSWWGLLVTETVLPLWLCGSDFSVLQFTWWEIATHTSGVSGPCDSVPSALLFCSLPLLSPNPRRREFGSQSWSNRLWPETLDHLILLVTGNHTPGVRRSFEKLLGTGQTVRDLHFDKDGREIFWLLLKNQGCRLLSGAGYDQDPAILCSQ